MVSPEFSAVRSAVLSCAKAGKSPQEVIALLIKISVEISQSTDALTETELREFVSTLWKITQGEQMIRIVEAMGVSEA